MNLWDDDESLLAEQDRLVKARTTAEAQLQVLSRTVLEGRNPPAGPYAFFHQSGNALEKLNNCGLILERLFSNRQRVTVLAARERQLVPENWPPGVPYPEEAGKVMREINKGTNYMRLDF